jgi:hypothetical protein
LTIDCILNFRYSEHAMGMFRRRRENLIRDVTAAVMVAVEERLKATTKADPADIADVGAKMLGGMTDFLKGAGDIALRGAASAMGQRGGRRTQEKRRAAKRLAFESNQPAAECDLCRDPLTRNVSIEMIMRHRAHEHRRAYERTQTDSARADDPAELRNANGLYGQQAFTYPPPDQTSGTNGAH